jgi:hypothetical protein
MYFPFDVETLWYITMCDYGILCKLKCASNRFKKLCDDRVDAIYSSFQTIEIVGKRTMYKVHGIIHRLPTSFECDMPAVIWQCSLNRISIVHHWYWCGKRHREIGKPASATNYGSLVAYYTKGVRCNSDGSVHEYQAGK